MVPTVYVRTVQPPPKALVYCHVEFVATKFVAPSTVPHTAQSVTKSAPVAVTLTLIHALVEVIATLSLTSARALFILRP